MEKNNINDENIKSDVMNAIDDNFIIDMHCHPGIRPYSTSIEHGRRNSPNPRDSWSIWHYNPPRGLDKTLNRCANLTKFSQANFTELARGNVKIISACLYPIEHGFGSLRGRKGRWPDWLFNFISEIGYTRINEIQDNQDYFQDLGFEYEYYKDLDGLNIKIDGEDFQYRLIKRFADLPDCDNLSNNNVIWVVLSIEGSHVFHDGKTYPAIHQNILDNIDKVKNWDHRPLYISVAHHFYNELCGHDESFPKFLKKRLSQFVGMHGGFTLLGRKVVERLLDNSEGKRMLIDIKHMSTRSREDYYEILESPKFKDEEIPIIVSHGAVNGLKSFSDRRVQIKNSEGKFNRVYINTFDCEIVKIFDSGGFIGIQLDERRIASKSELLQSNGKKCKWRRLYKKSEIFKWNNAYKRNGNRRENLIYNMSQLVWNQIQHIAEVLDKEEKFAWGTAVLGSDFDGLIDPIEVYWTSRDLRYLENKLLKITTEYMNTFGQNLRVGANRNIEPGEIVDKFLRRNACDFLATFYQ